MTHYPVADHNLTDFATFLATSFRSSLNQTTGTKDSANFSQAGIRKFDNFVVGTPTRATFMRKERYTCSNGSLPEEKPAWKVPSLLGRLIWLPAAASLFQCHVLTAGLQGRLCGKSGPFFNHPPSPLSCVMQVQKDNQLLHNSQKSELFAKTSGI